MMKDRLVSLRLDVSTYGRLRDMAIEQGLGPSTLARILVTKGLGNIPLMQYPDGSRVAFEIKEKISDPKMVDVITFDDTLDEYGITKYLEMNKKDEDLEFNEMNSDTRGKLRKDVEWVRSTYGNDTNNYRIGIAKVARKYGLLEKKEVLVSNGGVTFNSTRPAPDINPISKADQIKWMKKSKKKGKL